MAFTPIPGAIQAVIKAQQYGEDRVNVLHFLGDLTVTPENMTSVATLLTNFVADPAFLALFSSSVSFVSITVRDVSVVAGEEIIVPATTSVGTNNTGVPMPGNVALVVSLKTGVAGRSGSGRIYMYGLTTGQLNSAVPDQINSGAQSAYVGVFEGLLTDSNTAGVPLAVASRKRLTCIPVQSIIVDLSTDSQRRRLRGRGR